MGPEVLLSAMFLENEDYIDTLFIHTDCVVINQCDSEDVRRSVRDSAGGHSDICYVKTRERGLSKSRNMALSYAKGPVCILCDNDVEYVSDYDRIINDAFSRHPDADLRIKLKIQNVLNVIFLEAFILKLTNQQIVYLKIQLILNIILVLNPIKYGKNASLGVKVVLN